MLSLAFTKGVHSWPLNSWKLPELLRSSYKEVPEEFGAPAGIDEETSTQVQWHLRLPLKTSFPGSANKVLKICFEGFRIRQTSWKTPVHQNHISAQPLLRWWCASATSQHHTMPRSDSSHWKHIMLVFSQVMARSLPASIVSWEETPCRIPDMVIHHAILKPRHINFQWAWVFQAKSCANPRQNAETLTKQTAFPLNVWVWGRLPSVDFAPACVLTHQDKEAARRAPVAWSHSPKGQGVKQTQKQIY